MKRHLPLASLLLLLATPIAAAVSASLTVAPTRVLPGVAPSMHVVVTNESDREIALPQKLLLRVVPSQGAPFMAEWGGGQEHPFSNARFPGDSTVTVAARSSREIVFRSYALDRVPGWFYDARLNLPGTYRLQLLMLDKFSETAVSHADALNLETVVPVAVTSSEAVLTIDTPTGADAELWRRLEEIAKRHGASSWSPLYWPDPAQRQFVRDAVEEHPESPYAAYVMRAYAASPAGDSLSSEERVLKAERILKAQPASAAREDLQLFIAQMEIRVAQHAASLAAPDGKRAALYYDRARADFQALERTARDPEIRQRSREERERIPDTAALREPNE